MPAVFKTQSNFTLGELNKALYARIDFEGYYKGVRRARNVLGTPRGGLLRRFGLRNEFELTQISSSEEFIFYNIKLLNNVYLLVFRPLAIDIYFNNVLQQTLVSPYTLSQIQGIKIQKLTSSLVVVQGENAPQELAPITLPSSWSLTPITLKNQPTFDFEDNYEAINFTPSATTGAITLTADSPIFTVEMVGGIFEGNGGIMRIEGFTSTTIVTGTTLQDFVNTTAIPGNVASLREPIFSATRGFPKVVGFTQQRLVFAATDSIPSLATFSQTNDYFNFDEGTGNDSDAIVAITTPVDNEIRQIYDTNALVLFGTNVTLATPVTYEVPITPRNIYFSGVDNNGIADVEVWKIDNQIMFVDKGGRIVRALKFNIDQSAFAENSISVLSPQLITVPVYSDRLKNPTINDALYLFMINEDGTVGSYHTLEEENVGGWTGLNTPGANGKFRHITGDGDEIWFVTERTIQGSQRFFVEKLNFNLYTDMTHVFSFGGPTTTVTGLDDLEGETVQVRGDGYVLEEEVVSGGEIELSRASTEVEVGLGFFPEIIPMPINIQTQSGNDIYFRKRVVSFYVDYIDSLGIFVNNILLPNLKFSATFFPDQPPTPQDGVEELTIFNANWWNPRAEIMITQKDPLPMHLIGLGQEVQSEEQFGG